MKRIAFSTKWFVGMAIVLLLLTACERPAPRPEDAGEGTDAPPATIDVSVPTETPVPAGTEAVPSPTEESGTTVPDPTAEGGDATAVPPEPTATPTVGERTHTVRAGETLFSLAQQYGLTVEELAAANDISNVNVLEVGQQLEIPAPGTVEITPTETPAPSTEERVHIVRPGENLFRIGLQYGFTVEELAEYNGITNVNVLEVGQQIRIPPRN